MMLRVLALALATWALVALPAPAASNQCATPKGTMSFNPCAVLDASRVHYANEPVNPAYRGDYP